MVGYGVEVWLVVWWVVLVGGYGLWFGYVDMVRCRLGVDVIVWFVPPGNPVLQLGAGCSWL